MQAYVHVQKCNIDGLCAHAITRATYVTVLEAEEGGQDHVIIVRLYAHSVEVFHISNEQLFNVYHYAIYGSLGFRLFHHLDHCEQSKQGSEIIIKYVMVHVLAY